MSDTNLLSFGFPDPPIEEHTPGRPGVPVGTMKMTEKGYVLVKTDVRTWKYEHRLRMEIAIGRPLHQLERVFHKNGDLSDNRLVNLILGTLSTPLIDRSQHCLSCTCVNEPQG